MVLSPQGVTRKPDGRSQTSNASPRTGTAPLPSLFTVIWEAGALMNKYADEETEASKDEAISSVLHSQLEAAQSLATLEALPVSGC